MSAVFAETTADMTDENIIKVTTLIDGGLFKNHEAIADASALLTPEQKEAVYAENDKPWWPFALNLGIGYGVGSYVQGDYGFAAVSTCVDAVCDIGICVFYGLTYRSLWKYADDHALSMKEYSSTGKWKESDAEAALGETYKYIIPMCGFALVQSVYRIFESIRPVTYANKYNTALKSALYEKSGGAEVTFNFAPVFDTDNNLRAAVACRICY